MERVLSLFYFVVVYLCVVVHMTLYFNVLNSKLYTSTAAQLNNVRLIVMRLCGSMIYRNIDLIFDLGISISSILGLTHNVIGLCSICPIVIACGILCSSTIASKHSVDRVPSQNYLSDGGGQERRKFSSMRNNCKPCRSSSIARSTGLGFNLGNILLFSLMSMMAGSVLSLNHITGISFIVMAGGILCLSHIALPSKCSINGVLSQYFQSDGGIILWNNCHQPRLCGSRSNTHCIRLYFSKCDLKTSNNNYTQCHASRIVIVHSIHMTLCIHDIV